jgi:hypothetical protein
VSSCLVSCLYLVGVPLPYEFLPLVWCLVWCLLVLCHVCALSIVVSNVSSIVLSVLVSCVFLSFLFLSYVLSAACPVNCCLVFRLCLVLRFLVFVSCLESSCLVFSAYCVRSVCLKCREHKIYFLAFRRCLDLFLTTCSFESICLIHLVSLIPCPLSLILSLIPYLIPYPLSFILYPLSLITLSV